MEDNIEEKFSNKFYNKLFFKAYMYFGIILVVFAMIIGIIFLRLNADNTTDVYRSQLQNKATKIAKKITEFIITPNETESSAYIRAIEDMESEDLWIISNHDGKKPLSSSLENVMKDFDIETLEENRKVILKKAFKGDIEYGTEYSESHGIQMVTVGVPIKDGKGNVSGAILISSPVENLQKVISSSKTLIFTSTIVALIISIIIAFLFARKLSLPISKMRKTSLKLAEGDYTVKTGIVRRDELGELASIIDILADKLQKNELEHQNMEQMRLDFFANVSHELRTPITVVRAYVETLADGVVTEPTKVAKYYERMLSECNSMQRLVGDLLVLSKMQNPEFLIVKEPINVVQIFSDIIRSTKAISSDKHIKIEIEKEKDMYMILGDYERIRQMFRVILDNAVKFSCENGIIHIKMTGTDILKVSIRDEGVGIKEEEIPNIFDKFYKSKLRQNATGSGLGLAIAKQILLKHGGEIEVKSEVNKGTEFIFSFKVITEEELNNSYE